MASDIRVYGTDWCGITLGVRKYLVNSRLAYEFHDIDRDPDAEKFVLATHDGRRHSPVVVVHDEVVLTSPTIPELRRVLDEQGIRSVAHRALK
jgi:mycoredoxin